MSFAAWVIAVLIVLGIVGLIQALIQDLRRKEGWMALAVLIILIIIIKH